MKNRSLREFTNRNNEKKTEQTIWRIQIFWEISIDHHTLFIDSNEKLIFTWSRMDKQLPTAFKWKKEAKMLQDLISFYIYKQ